MRHLGYAKWTQSEVVNAACLDPSRRSICLPDNARTIGHDARNNRRAMSLTVTAIPTLKNNYKSSATTAYPIVRFVTIFPVGGTNTAPVDLDRADE